MTISFDSVSAASNDGIAGFQGRANELREGTNKKCVIWIECHLMTTTDFIRSNVCECSNFRILREAVFGEPAPDELFSSTEGSHATNNSLRTADLWM